MTLSRRDLAVLAAAAALVPAAARAEPRKPLIIAHRGASGERPEDTRLAYDLAIDQGADFIAPGVTPTQDGVLVARHDNELTDSTDIARRPEFAARRQTKTVDGKPVSGWFAEDFTLAELKTLTCRERIPDIRPQSAKFDGQQPILTFQEVIDIARAGSVRSGRVIGVYATLKHPKYFSENGLGLEERVAEVIRLNGYNSPAAAMFVQCLEPGALKAFGRLSRARRVQMVDTEGSPFDAPELKFADMLTPDGLKAVKAYADVIGPSQAAVLDLDAEPFPAMTPLVTDAHAAGLQVHSWTARPENTFLPRRLQKGDPKRPDFARKPGDFHGLMMSLFTTRLEGVFTDVTAPAVKARDDAMALMAKQDKQRRP